MEGELAVALVVMVAVVALGAAGLGARAARGAAGELGELKARLEADSAALQRRLEGVEDRLFRATTESSAIARGVFEALGDVKRSTALVAEEARRFGALSELLRAPGARGSLGETLLEELLRQVLPPGSYAFKHRFGSGVVVDAVVRAGDSLVCIDCKFPLANLRRALEAGSDVERAGAERAFVVDVERHVRDIAARYIVPDEGTLDFAVMYVPAEGVYAEILRAQHRGRPLTDIALEARVVPMSPLTMYGFLQTVLFGLRCLRIERGARAVLERCGALQREVERFAADYETLGRHLANARVKYDDGRRRLDRVEDGFGRMLDDIQAPAPGGGGGLDRAG